MHIIKVHNLVTNWFAGKELFATTVKTKIKIFGFTIQEKKDFRLYTSNPKGVKK